MKYYLLFLLAHGALFANIGPQGFHPYPNRYFVETGSGFGGGIIKALEAGFDEIFSIDVEPVYISHCFLLFKEFPQVHLFRLDSGMYLYQVIDKLDEPITFWLDAHRGIPDLFGGKNTPLMEELEQIKRHPIKTHTILIDDMHCCDTEHFDFLTLQQIIGKVLEINSDYEISFQPGGDEGEYPQNVLVASLPAGFDAAKHCVGAGVIPSFAGNFNKELPIVRDHLRDGGSSF
jgi:hypothetical protein